MRSHRLLARSLAGWLACLLARLLARSLACLLDPSRFKNLQDVCVYQVASSPIFADSMELTALMKLDENLHQAGKIHNI